MSLPKHKPMTPEESEAVTRLREAVESLPPSLCLGGDDFHKPDTLTVWKQDAPGVSTEVAAIPCRLV